MQVIMLGNSCFMTKKKIKQIVLLIFLQTLQIVEYVPWRSAAGAGASSALRGRRGGVSQVHDGGG